jgi:hypothetical protein
MKTTALGGIRVYWSMSEWLGDMLAMVDQRWGTLTTEHPQSCYGQPVLVGDDGAVYGPADLPTHAVLSPSGGYPAEMKNLKLAAVAAGFRLA